MSGDEKKRDARLICCLLVLGFCMSVPMRFAHVLVAQEQGQAEKPPENLLAQLTDEDLAKIKEWWLDSKRVEVPLALPRAVFYTKRIPRQRLHEQISGRVQSVESLGPKATWDDLLELPQLWSIRLIDDHQTECTLIVPEIPLEWRKTPMDSWGKDERVRALGIVLAQDAPSQSDAPAQSIEKRLMVASRLSWLPSRATERIPQDWVQLSELGIDAAGWEALKPLTNQPLSANEADIFYPLMALQRDAKSNELLAHAQDVSVVKWLSEPQAWIGKLVRAELWTRRATKIAVTDPAVINLIGQDHYWQIDAFADLGNVHVQFQSAEKPNTPVEFGSRYPVNVVALELPPGLRQGILDDAGPNAVVSKVNVPIVADAVFYRSWGYESDWMRENVGERQTAPLIIAYQLGDGTPSGLNAESLGKISWLWASLILATLATGVIFVWRSYVSDRKAQAKSSTTLSQTETIFLQSLGEEKTTDSAEQKVPSGDS